MSEANADPGHSPSEERSVVLYRCPTPTNVLCPCGAVARRLGKLGLAYRTERLPYRRSARAEIEELTRQRRVPVLVDGDEIVHDSRRILQYLDWKYGTEREQPAGASDEVAEDTEVPAESGRRPSPATPSEPGMVSSEEEPVDVGEASGGDVGEASGGAVRRLYNVKQWRRRKKQSS